MKYILILLIIGIVLNSSMAQLHERYVAKNRRLLEHSESRKCLTVEQDFSLGLESCNYDLPTPPTVSGVFQIVKSNRGGHLMKWASRPIPGAIEGCIQVQTVQKTIPSDSDDDDEVKTTEEQRVLLGACDPRSASLNWEFDRVSDGKYLLKKLPNGPCLAPTSHELKASMAVVSCESENPEHIWKICQNLNTRKCDN